VHHALVPAILLPALSIAALGGDARAQAFDYPDFSSTTGLTLNGDATPVTNQLNVTNGAAAGVGSVFYSSAVPVAEGFETTFRVRATTSLEGFAFVITNAPAGASSLGGNLWGLGYGFGNTTSPIGASLAVEFDGQRQNFLNDTSNDEVSVHTAGAFGNTENEGASIARSNTATVDNALHTIRIHYVPDQLTVYVDDLVNPVLTTTYTFEDGGTLLGGGAVGGLDLPGIDAFVGITASNPTGSNQRLEVLNWSWQSFFGPDACYEGNVLAATTGPHDVLTINNSNGAFLRTVRLNIADPFSFEVAPPPGEANAPFVLFATLGIADAATIAPTPYGVACFPLANVLDIGSFLAPYSAQVPPGIPLPFGFTFQAVMGTDSLNPGQFELSNAVALDFIPALPPIATNVTPNSAVAGGTITVTGDGFSPFATLRIDGVPVPVQSANESTITFLMPASVNCGATLTVRNPDGQEANRPFNPTPTITNAFNTSGPASGGTLMIVTGQGFAPGTTATFAGNPGNVSTATSTTLVISVPPGTPGPAVVELTTPGGCIATTNFTYL